MDCMKILTVQHSEIYWQYHSINMILIPNFHAFFIISIHDEMLIQIIETKLFLIHDFL